MLVLATIEVGLRWEAALRQRKMRVSDSRKRSGLPDPPIQLPLFDLTGADDGSALANQPAVAASVAVETHVSVALPVKSKRAATAGLTPSRRLISTAEARTVSEADLPDYPDDLSASVDRSIFELPARQLWFTYRDVQKAFGVSRATVARRMKMGLVPGIRFQDDRIIEDGPVRRFDRLQLRYLLLSVRSSPVL